MFTLTKGKHQHYDS